MATDSASVRSDHLFIIEIPPENSRERYIKKVIVLEIKALVNTNSITTLA